MAEQLKLLTGRKGSDGLLEAPADLIQSLSAVRRFVDENHVLDGGDDGPPRQEALARGAFGEGRAYEGH